MVLFGLYYFPGNKNKTVSKGQPWPLSSYCSLLNSYSADSAANPCSERNACTSCEGSSPQLSSNAAFPLQASRRRFFPSAPSNNTTGWLEPSSNASTLTLALLLPRAASSEQSTGVAQVGEAVTQMDQATQQNAALVEEMAAAASSLSQQAQDLVQTVAVFKLDQSASSGHAQTRPAAPWPARPATAIGSPDPVGRQSLASKPHALNAPTPAAVSRSSPDREVQGDGESF